ncbi:hypothetical protein ILYODFUR_008746 [Ilyodon furcidens]|uniref:Uncharacterized protein n=1 Tax=Ilyodon furcidens TaxID=33524 RepID=A0ABV0U3S7_9TELE
MVEEQIVHNQTSADNRKDNCCRNPTAQVGYRTLEKFIYISRRHKHPSGLSHEKNEIHQVSTLCCVFKKIKKDTVKIFSCLVFGSTA